MVLLARKSDLKGFLAGHEIGLCGRDTVLIIRVRIFKVASFFFDSSTRFKRGGGGPFVSFPKRIIRDTLSSSARCSNVDRSHQVGCEYTKDFQ